MNSPVLLLISYFVGAIPVGYIIARLKGIADIRKHGSGNIGATNVSRVLGISYFFLIFFIDAGKAFACMYVMAPYCSPDYLYLCAALLLFGNGCSIFLRGTGGKGVATLFGLLAALCSNVVLPLLGAWLIVLALTRTVGIASVGAVVLLPVYVFIFFDQSFAFFCLYAACWIVWTHRTNICAYAKNFSC